MPLLAELALFNDTVATTDWPNDLPASWAVLDLLRPTTIGGIVTECTEWNGGSQLLDVYVRASTDGANPTTSWASNAEIYPDRKIAQVSGVGTYTSLALVVGRYIKVEWDWNSTPPGGATLLVTTTTGI